MHRWNLSSVNKEGTFHDLLSGRNGIVSNNGGKEQQGILSLQNASFASIDFRDSCISDPFLCEQGLSVSFWLRHKRHSAENCPEDWKYFQGSCYYFSTDTATTEGAQNFCKQQGADLIKITSSDENDFVSQNKQAGNVRLGSIRNPLNNKTFVWMDGSSLNYVNWRANEPNNSLGQEACVDSEGFTGWNDVICNNKVKYICEKGLYQYFGFGKQLVFVCCLLLLSLSLSLLLLLLLFLLFLYSE